MSETLTPSLVALAVTILLVFRFARTELRERTVRARTLWIRPVLLLAITIYLIGRTMRVDAPADGELLEILVGAVVLGAIVGVLIVRNTRFAPAAQPRAAKVIGNPITFIIWVGALAIRLLVRYVVPYGADAHAQLPLNCGTIAMTAVAFVVIALATWMRIRGYDAAALTASPAETVPGRSTRQ